MEGVTILSQKLIEISERGSAWCLTWWIIGGILVIAYMIAIFVQLDGEGAFGAIGIGIIFFLIGLAGAPREAEMYYEYKVTVDETVSMVEFYNNYEIISQEGLIFTVRDIE